MNGGDNLEDGPERGEPTVLTGYEWDGATEPSSDVVEGVARVTGHDPEQLPVLHESIEVDALNALVSTEHGERGRIAVSFTYSEAAVTVANTGTITVDTSPRSGP
jgi:hypothetical protein